MREQRTVMSSSQPGSGQVQLPPPRGLLGGGSRISQSLSSSEDDSPSVSLRMPPPLPPLARLPRLPPPARRASMHSMQKVWPHGAMRSLPEEPPLPSGLRQAPHTSRRSTMSAGCAQHWRSRRSFTRIWM